MSQPLMPIANLPPEYYPNPPVGVPLIFTVSVVNNLDYRLTDWMCKVSLTGWQPGSEMSTTFMHHWSTLFRNLTIPAKTTQVLGEVTLPPLPDKPLQYHLVLQLFNLQEDSGNAIINTYVLEVQL